MDQVRSPQKRVRHSIELKTPTPLYKKKSHGLKQTLSNNFQFFSFKSRLKKVYKAIEFERSRQESNNFSNDLESIETFELFCVGLKRSKSLQVLNLSSTDLPDVHMMWLAQGVSKNKSLVRLDLSNNHLSSLGLKYLLRMLKENTRLQELNLFNNEIQRENIQDISSLIVKNKSLVRINLNFCGIESMGCRTLLEALTSNSHFKQISLNKNAFDNKSIQALSYFLSKPHKIEKLEFSFNQLDEDSLKIMVRRLKRFPIKKFLPRIDELNLMGNRFLTQNSLKYLNYILERIRGIQTLNLSKTFLNYKNISDLAPSFKRIKKTLILANNIFKDQLPENLSYLQHLQCLNLSKTKLTGASVMNIAQMLKNESKIRWVSLDLSHNQIFDEECKVLFQALRVNKSLQFLNLCDNLLDEEVFEGFDEYGHEWSLKQLILSENPFNNIEFLNELFGLGEKFPLTTLEVDNVALKRKFSSLMSSLTLTQNVQAFQKLEKLSLKNSLSIGPCFVKFLFGFTGLQELVLENSCILNTELLQELGIFLGASTRLTNLSLRNLYLGNLANSDRQILCNALQTNTSISKLDLAKNKLNKVLAEFLKACGKIRTLKSIDISGNFIDNSNSTAISALLLDCPGLEEYILSDNRISFSTIEDLCATIAENNERLALKTLKLANVWFSLDCLSPIGQLLRINNKLQELDISNNEIVKLNTASLRKKPVGSIRKLCLTNCKYDEDQYSFLLEILGKHPIDTLDLSGSIFFQSTLTKFVESIAELKTLIHLDLSYIALKDKEIAYLLSKLKGHEKLSQLTMNFLDLKEKSGFMIFQTLKQNNSIQTLDVSDNKLPLDFFEQLKNGLVHNKTLKTLKMRKTRMTDETLQVISEAFTVNRSVKSLDLRFNSFSIKSLDSLMIKLNSGLANSPRKTDGLEELLLSENHLECQTEISELSLLQFSEQVKLNKSLRVLDLENTFASKPREISSLSQSLKCSDNLKILNLSNNKLGAEDAVFLSKLILECISLEFLSVSRNRIGVNGIKILLENLDKNLTLNEIDLSGTVLNQNEGDELCEFLHNILLKYQTLEIIDISGNNVGEKGNKVLVGTLRKNRKVYFINRQWNKIRNDLACELIDSLIRLYKKFSKIEEVKISLRHLNFASGKLDDDFCIHFSHRIQSCTYLESLNISENKKITLIGLKFIFVYLKFNVCLKRIYFKEYSRDSALNNGISTSLIHWSKYTHYRSRVIKLVQKITYSVFSKMQIVPNRFQYNETFDQFFESISDRKIFFFFLFNFILQIFLALFLPIYWVVPICGRGQYWVAHIVYGIYLGITLLFEFVFWLVTKWKIQSGIVEKDLRIEYFLNDVLNLAGGVLLRFDTYTDICFLTIAYECDTDKIFTGSLAVVSVKLIVKTVENLRALYKLHKRILKKQKMDCLNLYAKLCCFQSFVITNDILDRYCPGNAKRIHHILCKKLRHSIYLNIFILDSLLKFALEDIPQTILQSLFLFYKNGGNAAQNSENWIIWFSVLKNGLSLIGSFYSMVSVRPSYIEQSDFDESLTVQKLFEGKNDRSFGLSFIKRYGTLENRNKITGNWGKLGTGVSNMSNSLIVRTKLNIRESKFKPEEEASANFVVDMNEEIGVEKNEKLKYFATEEKSNFLESVKDPHFSSHKSPHLSSQKSSS